MASLVDRIRTRALTAEDRLEKATDVERLGKTLLSTWRQCVGQGCSWYMHAAAHHLPDMIRGLPCDILDASGEGLEQKNQRSKANYRRYGIVSYASVDLR